MGVSGTIINSYDSEIIKIRYSAPEKIIPMIVAGIQIGFYSESGYILIFSFINEELVSMYKSYHKLDYQTNDARTYKLLSRKDMIIRYVEG